MFLGPTNQEFVLLWRMLWSISFQEGSRGASMQIEAGLPGKMKQIWKICRSSPPSFRHADAVWPWKMLGVWQWDVMMLNRQDLWV